MADFFRPRSYAMKVDPTLKYAWINIPKNGSSFIQKVLEDNAWNDVPDNLINSIAESPSIKKIVVLRDPVERWISGFAQCMSDTGSLKILDLLDNDMFITTIRMNPVYDDHTEYQHRFIGNAQNLEYIYMQKTRPNEFFRLFATWIRRTGGTASFDNWKDPVNPASNNANKLAINNKLSVQFNKDTMLKDLHKKDYELFEKYDRFTN
jgi:hypothetical protein